MHERPQSAQDLTGQVGEEAPAGKARSSGSELQEVWVSPGGGTHDGTRTERFVVCHNPEAATPDEAVRHRLIEHLRGLIDGSDGWPKTRRDELVGSLKSKPALRRTPAGLLCIDHTPATREAHLDGKWLLRTSDMTLTPDDLAAAYKQLIAVERGWRDCKGCLGPRPVYHHRGDRMHLLTLATADGRVAQRSATTTGQKTILDALQLPEPPKYLDFTTMTS